MSQSFKPFPWRHSEHREESLSAQGRLRKKEILRSLRSLRMTRSERLTMTTSEGLAANILLK